MAWACLVIEERPVLPEPGASPASPATPARPVARERGVHRGLLAAVALLESLVLRVQLDKRADWVDQAPRGAEDLLVPWDSLGPRALMGRSGHPVPLAVMEIAAPWASLGRMGRMEHGERAAPWAQAENEESRGPLDWVAHRVCLAPLVDLAWLADWVTEECREILVRLEFLVPRVRLAHLVSVVLLVPAASRASVVRLEPPAPLEPRARLELLGHPVPLGTPVPLGCRVREESAEAPEAKGTRVTTAREATKETPAKTEPEA